MTRAATAALVVISALATGCASLADSTPETTVVVVPARDGHVGAVMVESGESRTLLDERYQAVRSGRTGAVRTTALSADEVEDMFGDARAARPAPPVMFLLEFEIGSDRLTRASRDRFPDILAAVTARDIADIRVEGHTDRQGSDENNLRLSQRRAERVRRDLIRSGLDGGIIRAQGMGEQQPLVDTADEVQEPRNRRVEIFVR